MAEDGDIINILIITFIIDIITFIIIIIIVTIIIMIIVIIIIININDGDDGGHHEANRIGWWVSRTEIIYLLVAGGYREANIINLGTC